MDESSNLCYKIGERCPHALAQIELLSTFVLAFDILDILLQRHHQL